MSTALLAALILAAAPAPATAEVPFVGCATDGQLGFIAPPERKEIRDIPATGAPGLAYYATRSTGTLAPAGWHCFGAHGSNGERLVIAPEPLDFDKVRGMEIRLTGPAVEMDQEYGFTSGRYAILPMIERYFPAHRAFVHDAASPEDPPRPAEERSADWVLPLGTDAIAFETPAEKEGIGTLNGLAPGAHRISGLVMLHPEDDMTMRTLSVRLGAANQALERAILESTAAARGITLPAPQ
jgi:hypothetical protein